jgi:antitoxin component YwqK of YwqJK toxin-antitoxin module
MTRVFNSITILLITFYTVIGGCQENKNEPQDSTVSKKNKKHVERIGEVKLTYHKNGEVKSETEYRNGVREGLMISYDEEGNISSEVLFEKGKMIGEFKAYYPDGSLKMIANYVEGVLDGETLSYYPDGKLEAKQTYVKNKLVRNITYNKQGKIIFDDKL